MSYLKHRLAEVRAEEYRRHPSGQAALWRVINRTTAALEADQVLTAHRVHVHELGVDELEHEAERLEALPSTPLVCTLRRDVELERKDRVRQ